jgi:hypothetical protein
VGAPWHKFIPLEYIDRTMNTLSQRNLKDSVIEFEQVYKHKESGIFAALDRHTIFFANGRPVSDLVFITLTPSVKLPTPGPHISVLPRHSPRLLEGQRFDVSPSSPAKIEQIPFTPVQTPITNPVPLTPINEDSFFGPTSPMLTTTSLIHIYSQINPISGELPPHSPPLDNDDVNLDHMLDSVLNNNTGQTDPEQFTDGDYLLGTPEVVNSFLDFDSLYNQQTPQEQSPK